MAQNLQMLEAMLPYVKEVVAYLRKKGAGTLAEDIMQEVLLRIWKLEKQEEILNPAGYLYKAASHRFGELIKQKKHAEAVLTEADLRFILPMANSPDQELEALQAIEERMRPYTHMNPTEFKVHFLSNIWDETYEEIGRRAGISPSMVKKYLRSGRDKASGVKNGWTKSGRPQKRRNFQLPGIAVEQNRERTPPKPQREIRSIPISRTRVSPPQRRSEPTRSNEHTDPRPEQPIVQLPSAEYCTDTIRGSDGSIGYVRRPKR